MNASSQAAAVERNLMAFFRHVALAHPSGEAVELEGVSIASAGLQFHMFNAAFLAPPAATEIRELEDRLRTANTHFRESSRWALWACEDKLPTGLHGRGSEVFAKHGLEFAYRHPGMILEELPAPLEGVPRLEIQPVEDLPERMSFSHVNAAAFGVPFSWCQELYEPQQLWTGEFRGWLGCVDGKAVCTVAILVENGAAGIYSVATLPGHRRRGYAEVLVRHALGVARLSGGATYSVLQSTREGVPLYRRLGYRTVVHFSVFST
jgi:ribosomal protein S18 acetylase RimI-like enzyme